MTSTVSEWEGRALRPVAHWVTMPDPRGRPRLVAVWEVPDPLPSAAALGDRRALSSSQSARR
jgi:hypothetical protein